MLSRRLQRLAALTHGLALVGLGASVDACNNDPPLINSPPQPPTVNSPPLPVGDAGATDQTPLRVTPSDAGDAGLEFRPPHTVNAPPHPGPPPPPPAKP